MNKLSLLLSIGLLMAACNGRDTNAKQGEASILKKPPYAALTDSIHRSSGKDDRAGLYYRRAELLSRNDLHELAAADFQKAWNLHPDEATGLRYASTLTIVGRLREAIRLLQDCRKLFPANAS